MVMLPRTVTIACLFLLTTGQEFWSDDGRRDDQGERWLSDPPEGALWPRHHDADRSWKPLTSLITLLKSRATRRVPVSPPVSFIGRPWIDPLRQTDHFHGESLFNQYKRAPPAMRVSLRNKLSALFATDPDLAVALTYLLYTDRINKQGLSDYRQPSPNDV